jgi:NAD(P)-dependent dehydrogenase (short-subunit alcohol dehydrogenase family)
LTKCWALELGKKQITVNSVCPGWVRTQSNLDDIKEWAKEENKSFDEKYKELSDPLILGRFVEPEEVAGLVNFLASLEGGGITGQIYEIK